MIEIRPIEPRDVPGVLGFVADVLREFGLEFGKGSSTDTELEQLPASYVDRGGAFWVAVRSVPEAGPHGSVTRGRGGELFGTCGVFPIEPTTFELRKMYLRGPSRGLGLGKRMLDLAVEHARANGGTRMVLDTVESMTRAIAFYEAHGFARDDAWIRGPRCSRGYVRVL